MLVYSAWPCALPGSVTSGSRCAGRRSARHQDGLADRGPGLDRRVRFGGLGQRENLADRRAPLAAGIAPRAAALLAAALTLRDVGVLGLALCLTGISHQRLALRR